MYLKSLTLRGFKSFAKSTTLNFHECVSSVVGPNGSGKSNISDAILWVLGERSAKNIRGDAMEDVIFSGAKNKGRAAMAEVSLCLDNTDGTLNIDYNEVVITRRMYRSGESDYWLNDSSVRRLDIIDILHDSGLGSGTHSIISQGSLDSVLGYDEIQLREMIDEAAGISKHKLKKEKSLKKLEKMQANFDRISDITLEVERQLGPLKRRAKRAEQYKEVSDKLNEATLKLAVDDYRKQTAKKDELAKAINSRIEKIEETENKIEEAKSEIEALTSKIQSINEQNEKLSEVRNKSTDKLNELKLICEKTTQVSNQIDLVISRDANEIEELGARVANETADMQKTEVELSQVCEKLASLEDENENLRTLVNEANGQFSKLREMEASYANARREHQKRIDDNKGELAQIKATLEGRRARLEFLNNKKGELEEEVANLKASLETKEASATALNETFEKAKSDDASASELLKKCASAKKVAEESLMSAKSEVKAIDAQLSALVKLSQQQDVDSKALNLIESVEENLSLLMKLISVDKEVEDVAEFLLSDYLNSIVAGGDIAGLASRFKEKNLGAPISMLEASTKVNGNLEAVEGAKNITEFIKTDEYCAQVILNLLGDVYVCDSAKTCFELHKRYPYLRFVTREGFFVGNKGEVVIDSVLGQKNKGALERARQVDELKETLEEAKEKVQSLEKSATAAIKSLEDAQRDSLAATQFLTKVTVQVEAINDEVKKAKAELESKEASLAQTIQDINSSNDFVESSLPDIASIEETIRREQELLNSLQIQINENARELGEKEEEKNALSTSLSKLLANLAQVRERKSYLDNLQAGRKAQVERANKKLEVLKGRSAANRENKENSYELTVFLTKIFDEVNRALAKRNEEFGSLQSTDAMFSRVSDLRGKQDELLRDKDLLKTGVTEAQVESARIDGEMGSLVEKIESAASRPLIDALLIPKLEDRAGAQADFDELSAKIKRLGNVDYSARQEYEDLSERYEFLVSNLEDIKKSIYAIEKIDEMIDVRFKDEFEQTFASVRENFAAVFSEFFPGGAGSLELCEREGEGEAGLVINANPAGKKIRRISLLSGGEKSLVALSFLFAIFQARKTPFYVLDEVEAALDDTNLSRLLAYVDKMRNTTQFIFITHQRRTMELSDVLFGVSMQEDGVTKVISQRLDVALQNAE